ncbi:MAG: phosphotransferase family protein [Gordonia sp.]|nr:phosphotransferase family protein [Gordonia sp. (in: high G+C Gram-positive bacteria)]
MNDLAISIESVLTKGDGAERTARVQGLRRLSGGASRETWSFAAMERNLILRRDPPYQQNADAMQLEAAAFAAADDAGVPVPKVLTSGDGSDSIGTPYLIMEHVDGEAIPRRLLRDPEYADARRALAPELGSVLAKIHSIPAASVPGLRVADPLRDTQSSHDVYGEGRPALEIAFRWLAENQPETNRRTVVHGDFRNGNLMVGTTPRDGHYVRAVLDWELVHSGDPMEDLGWLCAKAWRFGSNLPVGGFGTRDELLDGYANVAGFRPDPKTLLWWEVLATIKWAVICRKQVEKYHNGSDRSVEKAVLGRRIAESEYDALLAIGVMDAAPLDDVLHTPRPTIGLLTGGEAPNADELLNAVGQFLVNQDTVGADRFYARVAANAVQIARREGLIGSDIRDSHNRRLSKLGFDSDVALSTAIRNGELHHRWSDTVDSICESVRDKLRISNPGYVTEPR